MGDPRLQSWMGTQALSCHVPGTAALSSRSRSGSSIPMRMAGLVSSVMSNHVKLSVRPFPKPHGSRSSDHSPDVPQAARHRLMAASMRWAGCPSERSRATYAACHSSARDEARDAGRHGAIAVHRGLTGQGGGSLFEMRRTRLKRSFAPKPNSR